MIVKLYSLELTKMQYLFNTLTEEIDTVGIRLQVALIFLGIVSEALKAIFLLSLFRVQWPPVQDFPWSYYV